MSNTINGGYARGCGQMVLFIIAALLLLAGAALAFATELMSAPPASPSLPPGSPRLPSTNEKSMNTLARRFRADATRPRITTRGERLVASAAGRNRPLPAFESREDGLYLIFPDGEEAGPFADRERAEEFLKYVKQLQGAK